MMEVDMKNSLSLWQLFGFAATSLLGTLLHFLYDVTGGNVIAALFSGVNESTFEHMKLLFFPMLAFAIVQRLFFRERPDFWCVKLAGILSGLALIPMLFYTYNGAIGRSPDFVNIIIFFVSAAASYLLEYLLFKNERRYCPFNKAAFIFICLVGALFFVFTFKTPRLPIFLDPITNTYGI